MGIRGKGYKLVFFMLTASTLFTCIDPYSPKLDKFESLLVVDALITDEDISNFVNLSRTIDTMGKIPEMITGAFVTIQDDLGNSTVLNERNQGEYRTDSLTFRGVTGRTYTLHIKTEDGDEYESEPCLMYPAPDIDSIYFNKDQVMSEETGEIVQGITIYIDSRGESTSDYYRWTYEEWWKFIAPDPKMYDFINDSTIIPVAQVKQACWANKKSDVIDIETTVLGNTGGFVKRPVLFVASEETNRLLIQYCVEVRQLSVSKEEYEFWNIMLQINESGGDIFDKQPFQIISNIKSITDPYEQVIGYFQVSGAKRKQKYITVREMIDLNLPLYRYECERFEKGPIDFPELKYTFKALYDGFLNSGYTFIKPTYDNSSGELLRLVFVRPFCADCTLSGSLNKPDFWVDIE